MMSENDDTFLKDEISALECFQPNEGYSSNLLHVDLTEIQLESIDDPELSPWLPIHCENEDPGMLQLLNEEDENTMDTGHQVANRDKLMEIELINVFEVSINTLVEHHPIHQGESSHDLDNMAFGKAANEMNEESETSCCEVEVNTACPSLPLCGPPAKNSSKRKKHLYDCTIEDYEERKNKNEKKEDFLRRIKKASRDRDFRIRSKHFCENCLNMRKENQSVYELILKLAKIQSRKKRERKLKYFLKNLQK